MRLHRVHRELSRYQPRTRLARFQSFLSKPRQRFYHQLRATVLRPAPPSHLLSSQRPLIHTACGLQSARRGKLSSQEDAKRFVTALPPPERYSLEQALRELNKREDEDCVEIEKPSSLQLRLLCYQSSLPFIGFGFLDNFIMISVGEYLDWTVGVALGISTMAAAGIGNMISDLAGLGLADQVEALCRRLGIPDPRLSSAQMKHRSTRWTALLGRCIGIAIGCTIGMAPLYWINDPHKQHSLDQT